MATLYLAVPREPILGQTVWLHLKLSTIENNIARYKYVGVSDYSDRKAKQSTISPTERHALFNRFYLIWPTAMSTS